MDAEKEDKTISLFLESIGEWRKHVIIGGGYAPVIYRLYLVKQESCIDPIGTQDIDSLMPRKLPNVSESNLAKHLKNAGFRKTYSDLENPPAENYVKEIEGGEIEVEFITDNSARQHKERNIEISGVVAQPLTYLKLSISKTITFKTYSGVEGVVVSPDAWIFHKELTFVKRKTKAKSLKDLYGIWYVLTQLGDISEHMVPKIREIGLENISWFNTFRKNLSTWSEKATPAVCNMLESQDPNGRLKKLHFQKAIEKLLE